VQPSRQPHPMPWQHPCCHPVTPLRRCGVVGHAVLLRGYSDEPGSRLLLASTVLECCGVMVSSSVNWTSPQTAVRWPVVNVSRYLPGLPHYVRVSGSSGLCSRPADRLLPPWPDVRASCCCSISVICAAALYLPKHHHHLATSAIEGVNLFFLDNALCVPCLVTTSSTLAVRPI
jgi:hypothetical protein